MRLRDFETVRRGRDPYELRRLKRLVTNVEKFGRRLEFAWSWRNLADMISDALRICPDAALEIAVFDSVHPTRSFVPSTCKQLEHR